MRNFFRGTFPEPFWNCPVEELFPLLGGPALFYLQGRRDPPLLVSTLLHGDEQTGFLALREWLEPYRRDEKPLPRSLWVLVGNPQAASQNRRMLPGQPDYNRIWRNHHGPEAAWVDELIRHVRGTGLFATVDVHNNTGRNPHYSCVARWRSPDLQLASLFGNTVVHAAQPTETFTHRLSDFAPSVTVECGKSREVSGVEHTRDFLEACGHLQDFSPRSIPEDVRAYLTIARLRVPSDVDFKFSGVEPSTELWLPEEMDKWNFSELPAGTLIGRYRGHRIPLLVEDEKGQDPKLLSFKNGEIRTRLDLTPAMLTLSKRAIRNDCLCYLMVREELPTH